MAWRGLSDAQSGGQETPHTPPPREESQGPKSPTATPLPWLQFAPCDLEHPINSPAPTPGPHAARTGQCREGSRRPVDPEIPSRRGPRVKEESELWLLVHGVWGVFSVPSPCLFQKKPHGVSVFRAGREFCNGSDKWRMCAFRGGGDGTAGLFHRVWLVLCVDAFRCLQLSPCRGTARLGRSSKGHGMRWRSLEARRKVQY